MDPLKLGARMQKLRQPSIAPPPPQAWRAALSESFLALDLAPRLASKMRSESDHSAVAFSCLLEDDPSPGAVADAWAEALAQDRYVSAAEGLLFEFHASMRPLEFSKALAKPYSFVKTLHVIRARTGIALHDFARAINWRRPILHVSILKVARRYHRAAVSSESLTRNEHRKEFTGRLGVSTVLISRYEPVDLDTAKEAVEALKTSLAQGNAPGDATPYLLEAMSVLFDLTGDAEILEDALSYAGSPEDVARSSIAWALSSAEVALRLHDELDSRSRRADLKDYCARMLAVSENLAWDAEDLLRWTVLAGVLNALGTDDAAGIRGFRNPFGFRHAGHGNGILRLVPELIKAIRPLTRTGEPLARGIYADLLEYLPAANKDKLLAKLRLAVTMRGAGAHWNALADERSLLLTCRDRLHLAKLTDSESERRVSLKELIHLSARPTCATAALVLAAEDVERSGPSDVEEVTTWTADQKHVARMVRTGEFRQLLATAAADALASPDLSVAPLGGRSGVVTVSDYFDVVGGTFVFKSTTVLSWLRELRRSEALREALRGAALQDRYGVVDHLSPTEEEVAGLSEQTTVSSIRRFASGVVLSEYAAMLGRDQRTRAIALGAEYLGYINSLESLTGGQPSGMRKDVRVKEVGRWLKRLDVADPAAAFDDYWSCYEGLPSFRRRDAHPLNWLVVTEQRLLAVDLEATGWRPLTYEVAQLTEDSCLIPATDWHARLSVLRAYLGACGVELNEHVVTAFEASMLARSLRKLTPPTGFGQNLQHGREVLMFLAEKGSDSRVRRLAREIDLAWQRGRGLPAHLGGLNPEIKDSRRRRISRSMAFHLRHDRELERDSDGWADIEKLAARIGHGTESADLALVASDFREPRFEVAGSKIRALYGHTLPATIKRNQAPPQLALFHATNLSAAESVLTLHGLKAMQRQFVHLSSSPAVAIRSGFRHGPGILLTAESDHLSDLRHASETTYVARSVPAKVLRVTPIWLEYETAPIFPA